jgi:opacity protein-like surface antigen
MKRILIMCVIYVLLVSPVFSQDKQQNALSVSIGPAFATGQFASKDFFSETSGFAKPGPAFSLTYTRYLSEKFGITLSAQGQQNAMNVNALESEFGKNFSGFPEWSFDKRSWLYGAVLLGGTRQFALDKKNRLMLEVKAMAGIAFAKSPGMSGGSVNSTGLVSVEQNKASGSGFTFCTGAGINYAINKSLFLTAAVTYNGADKMKFKDVKTVTTSLQGTPGMPDYQAQQYITTTNEQQTISSVNLLFGIGFRF